MREPLTLATTDTSCIGAARRAATALAADLGFSARRSAELAIVVTEAASNIVRHAEGRGEIILRPLAGAAAPGVEMLAVDRGRGIPNLPQARRDGFSTLGSPGEGLGAIARQAGEFDIHSVPGQGTVVLARVWNVDAPPPVEPPGLSVGAVCLPKPGEAACGDNWSLAVDRDRVLLLVADGLGHGLQAADASRRAVELFRQHVARPVVPLMEGLHAGLRGTRGAALGLAELRPSRGQLTFVGVGNVAASVIAGDTRRSLVSHNGTAGVEARRIQEFQYPWAGNGLLVVHSDGLSGNWDLTRYAGVRQRHGAVVAATLYRDHRRIQDDVTVVTLAGRGAA